MLKLYCNPISPHSRRVLVALLEKEIEAELVELELNGQPNRAELLAINPFHHIPVLEDDGFRIVESFAILDYLEAKYPEPSLLPKDAQNLAKVRMVQMVTINELLPAVIPLAPIPLGFSVEPEVIKQSQKKVSTVLTFFEEVLGEQKYFIEEQLTLAEVTAGTLVSSLHLVGLSLEHHPKLNAWLENLNQRPAWVKSLPTQETMERFKASRSRA